MSELPIYPTADDIARAVVAAARLTGENPLLLFEGANQKLVRSGAARARYYTAEALRIAFPGVPPLAIGRMLGSYQIVSNLAAARKSLWWRDEHVDEAVGAILTPHLGESA